jgi:hypothetical protein
MYDADPPFGSPWKCLSRRVWEVDDNVNAMPVEMEPSLPPSSHVNKPDHRSVLWLFTMRCMWTVADVTLVALALRTSGQVPTSPTGFVC